MATEENSVLRKVYFFKIEHFTEIRESLPGAIRRIKDLPFNESVDTGLIHSRRCASALFQIAKSTRLKFDLVKHVGMRFLRSSMRAVSSRKCRPH